MTPDTPATGGPTAGVGGVYRGPGGQLLYGDGREVHPVSPPAPAPGGVPEAGEADLSRNLIEEYAECEAAIVDPNNSVPEWAEDVMRLIRRCHAAERRVAELESERDTLRSRLAECERDRDRLLAACKAIRGDEDAEMSTNTRDVLRTALAGR